ncbi:MAG: DNA repair protein RecO, partial [Hyphomicrobiales bacterium]|nr:DNA repair protein RecO [Hyphomicrobiales bacterium]
MEWRDEATVLSVRKHGEGSAVVECFVRDRGRWAGLVRGAGSPRLRAALQPGNLVEATWRARLADQLGNFAIETLRSRAADWMSASLPLHGLNWLVSLARLLPERDPHPAIHDAFAVVLEHLGDASAAPALFARFELAMLAELGFGLSLAQCALTGATEGLAFVSPRTGRAATAAAGAPFAGKLFALPGVLLGVGAPEADDVAAAL